MTCITYVLESNLGNRILFPIVTSGPAWRTQREIDAACSDYMDAQKAAYPNLSITWISARPLAKPSAEPTVFKAKTRCLVAMDYYFGQHTGTIEVVVDVPSIHEPGTKAFEEDALQTGYLHGDAGVFVVAGCNGLRVTVVDPDTELTPEREP